MKLTLTPNQRLAATLLREHAKQQTGDTWLTPHIISIPAWVSTLWPSFLFECPQKLLSRHEESMCWQTIVERSEAGKKILNPKKTAEQAQQAWQRLKEWNLDYTALNLDTHINGSIFLTWARDFDAYCLSQYCIDHTSALTAIIHHNTFLAELPYTEIEFYHFLELTPQQKALVAALSCHKTLRIITSTTQRAQRVRVEATHLKEEITAMVHWAKHTPHASVACVIPELTTLRPMIDRAFKQEGVEVDFSAGKKLSEYPIIRDALLLLKLIYGKHEIDDFSQVLRSPYWHNGEKDLSLRAMADKAIKKICRQTLSLKTFYRALVHALPTDTIFKTLLQTQRIFRHQASMTVFAQHSLGLLKQLGWPGERTLDSTEFQACQRFIRILNDMQGLALTVSFHDFYQQLFTITQEIIFQPETEKARIQVLGLLEASGLPFDAMWVMGLNDMTWPSKAKPNPFIPYQTQAQHHMPHANADRELSFCQALMQDLMANTSFLVLSSSQMNEGKAQKPSVLIESIPLCPDLLPTTPLFPLHHSLEILSDPLAPTLTSEEVVKGGTEIIRHQALCPFKAFAHFRLNITSLDQPSDTLDPRHQGILLHQALAYFWSTIRTQAGLKTTDTKKTILASVNRALTHIDKQAFPSIMIEVERERLCNIIQQSLEVELARPPFTVVATEKSQHYSLNGLSLHMRMDRMDQEENGHYTLIDYKSGKPNTKDWFGDRPKQPQLPLYCITNPYRVDTLVFFQLRHDDIAYKEAPCTEEQQQTWKVTFEQLAQDFSQGIANVDPLDTQTCEQCNLHSFCRIYDNDKNYS